MYFKAQGQMHIAQENHLWPPKFVSVWIRMHIWFHKKTLSLYHSFNFQFWSIWLSEFVCPFSFKFRWMSFRCILPSIYYQSCTSGEQYLVSYIYKKHYGFTKLQIQQMKQLRWLGRRRIYLYWFTNWIFFKLKLLMATHCWKA